MNWELDTVEKKNVDEIQKKSSLAHTVVKRAERDTANNVDKLHRLFVANVCLFPFLPLSIY